MQMSCIKMFAKEHDKISNTEDQYGCIIKEHGRVKKVMRDEVGKKSQNLCGSVAMLSLYFILRACVYHCRNESTRGTYSNLHF